VIPISRNPLLPREHTQPRQLLELIAISGDFPADLLNRLPGGSSYKESVIKTLKRLGLIRTFYRNRLRTYRLTAPAKTQLINSQPERFSFYLTGNVDTNHLKSEIPRRLRLSCIATVYVNMWLADICIFRDEKPEVFSAVGCPVSLLENNAFYSSRELKDMGLESTKIRGSRMVGVLLASSGVHVIYNNGSSLAKWETRSELRVKALLQMELCQRRLPDMYRANEIKAVLFGDEMKLAGQLLSEYKKDKKHYFVLDGSYEHFYFFTNDHHGEVLLKLLCNTDLTSELDHILSEGLRPQNKNGSIENDAIDSDGNPVLFGYFFDFPRIARFNTAINLQNQHGTIICFDFQIETLHHYCHNIRFQTIDFTRFERRFFS